MADRVVSLRPGQILSILLTEFGVLVFLLLCYIAGWLRVDRLPAVVAGVMPLIVPWGGALGGVCIGIVGVTAHWSRWGNSPNPPSRQALRWNGWYLARLPLGAAFGTVASLIVVLILGTVGTTDDGKIDVSPIGSATLFVIAFIVGYQQDVFRRLVERVVEVLLGPGSATPDDEGFTTDSALDFGPVAQNTESQKDVRIVNEGRSLLTVARGAIVIEGAGFDVVRVPGKLPGGDAGHITVRFAPVQAQEYKGELIVSIDGVTRKVALSGTGT